MTMSNPADEQVTSKTGIAAGTRSSMVGVALLVILALELMLSIRREAQTWDEACHIFAGYSYWTHGDFGMNPEHPPLVKLVATLPLLPLSLKVPPHAKVFSKEEDFTAATQFVYGNDAEAILFRSRMATAVFTLVLAISIFSATREMFGSGAAFLALILFVLEPTILAHGALVTTDMGMACLLFATIYGFYRYIKRPARTRLALTGLAGGMTLAAKHSAILIFPILLALAAWEVGRRYVRKESADAAPGDPQNSWKYLLSLGVALVAIGVISIAVLWASYGFHSEPRAGFDGVSRVVEYASRLKHPTQAKLISGFARWHLLPEAYLYGLADVGITAEFSRTYLLGTIYPHGKWFYFPVAMAIKSTLALLLLLLLVPIMIVVRRVKRWRELVFLAMPAAIYVIVAMTSGMNIGIRHILPAYPFLIVLAGWAAWQLIQIRRYWAYAIGVLLLFNIFSSLRSFPVYLAYSNELWGGPANTYKYLTDSNVDWGQQLKAVKKYLEGRRIDHCWFAYFAEVVADPAYYGIPCKPLTTIASVWLQPSIDVPASIDGPVLISASVLSGYEFGPGSLNPYDQFQKIHPTALIEHGVFVYDGHFDIPLAAALNHVTHAQLLATNKRFGDALTEAQTAARLAPQSVQTQAELGDILMLLNRTQEAQEAFQRALAIAQNTYPEFQSGWVPGLRSSLGKK
jgi:4-amino-4-deoxy-L-arabinose transferase-like glycosyltransferase